MVTTLLAAILGLVSCNSDSELSGNDPVLIIDPIETGLDEPTATSTQPIQCAYHRWFRFHRAIEKPVDVPTARY